MSNISHAHGEWGQEKIGRTHLKNAQVGFLIHVRGTSIRLLDGIQATNVFVYHQALGGVAIHDHSLRCNIAHVLPNLGPCHSVCTSPAYPFD
jgi:hypothetical protein